MRIILFFLLITGALSAQTLWQNTSAGMPKAEVEKLYPKQPTVEILKHNFDVGFGYENDKLNGVSLSCKDELSESTGDELFVKMETLLTSKYGPKINSESANGMPVVLAIWQKDGVQIKLQELRAGHRTHLSIIYDKSLKEEAAKI